MSAHTNGPWVIDDDGENLCVVRAEECGAFIAECCDGFYNDDGDWVRAGTVEANAQLIAAAPALLAVLREIVAMTDEPTSTFRKRGGTYRGLVGALASDAIAKATGAES